MYSIIWVAWTFLRHARCIAETFFLACFLMRLIIWRERYVAITPSSTSTGLLPFPARLSEGMSIELHKKDSNDQWLAQINWADIELTWCKKQHSTARVAETSVVVVSSSQQSNHLNDLEKPFDVIYGIGSEYVDIDCCIFASSVKSSWRTRLMGRYSHSSDENDNINWGRDASSAAWSQLLHRTVRRGLHKRVDCYVIQALQETNGRKKKKKRKNKQRWSSLLSSTDPLM